jgi:hypothetical protein
MTNSDCPDHAQGLHRDHGPQLLPRLLGLYVPSLVTPLELLGKEESE